MPNLLDLPKQQYWEINQTKKFLIDTSKAGRGALNFLSKKGEVVITTKSENNETVVTITPTTLGHHEVDTFFGGKQISSGTMIFEVLDFICNFI